MSNSAFQQRQTGNASEAGAGSVQKATPAEVLAGIDVGSSGAPLFVVPSLIPKGGLVEEYIAYEPITAGAAVGLSYYAPLGDNAYSNEANGDGSLALSDQIWSAQRFTVPTEVDGKEVMGVASVHIRATTANTNPSTVSVRAALDGADIASRTHTSVQGSPVFFDVGTLPALGLVPGGTYFMVAREGSATDSGFVHRYSTTNQNPPEDSQAYQSNDGGATFTPQNDRNYIIRIDVYVNNSLGHREIYLSSAAAFDNRFGFVGFALNNAAVGEIVRVNVSRKCPDLSGLTAGKMYFLSDTNGAITDTPGTLHLELGYALNSTTLIRPPYQHVGRGIRSIPNNGNYHLHGYVTLDNPGYATYHYQRAIPEIGNFERLQLGNTASEGMTYMVSPGDSIGWANTTTPTFYPMIGASV